MPNYKKDPNPLGSDEIVLVDDEEMHLLEEGGNLTEKASLRATRFDNPAYDAIKDEMYRLEDRGYPKSEILVYMMHLIGHALASNMSD